MYTDLAQSHVRILKMLQVRGVSRTTIAHVVLMPRLVVVVANHEVWKRKEEGAKAEQEHPCADPAGLMCHTPKVADRQKADHTGNVVAAGD